MIRLTNQTFMEAGGNEVYPDLEMVGIVASEEINRRESSYDIVMDDLNSSLKRNANNKGCSYIFNIKYEHIEKGHSTAIGTGYKPKL
ncbi:MAG: hypothetical protein HQ534_08945 [Armatimonadetes bacterium]|nr:hypothetical protein [Armatimonadota bacterium]